MIFSTAILAQSRNTGINQGSQNQNRTFEDKPQIHTRFEEALGSLTP